MIHIDQGIKSTTKGLIEGYNKVRLIIMTNILYGIWKNKRIECNIIQI